MRRVFTAPWRAVRWFFRAYRQRLSVQLIVSHVLVVLLTALVIELAVAGFRREEIEITSHQNVLIIRGRKTDETGADYIHRGIATRSFERRFALADHVQVTGADLADGMLALTLKREIPEAMKPRRIAIGGTAAGNVQQLEAKAA